MYVLTQIYVGTYIHVTSLKTYVYTVKKYFYTYKYIILKKYKCISYIKIILILKYRTFSRNKYNNMLKLYFRYNSRDTSGCNQDNFSPLGAFRSSNVGTFHILMGLHSFYVSIL